MKVQRYLYGKTNVEQLKSGRAALRSPAEVAAEAYAPYGAVSDIAGAAADTVKMYREREIKEENEADAMASGLNVSNYKNSIKNAEEQAVAEGWSKEQYEGEIGAINKALAGSSNLIGERNRPEIDKSYRNIIGMQALETQRVSYGIQRKQQKDDYLAQRAQATQNKDWETVTFLDNIATQSNLIDAETSIKLTAETEAQITSEKLMPQYAAAVEAGKVDEFMSTLNDMNLTDEEWAAFSDDQAIYDKTTKEVENNIRVAHQIDYNAFKKTVGPNTSQESVDAYINDNKWLTGGQINSLNAAMETAENDAALIMGPTADTYSSTRRKTISKMVNTDQPPEDIWKDSVGLTTQIGTSPDVMSNMLNGYADSIEVGALTTAGNWMKEYYENPVTAGVPMPMREKTSDKIGMFLDLVNGHIPDADAERTTNEFFKNQTDTTIQAHKAAWNSDKFGTDGTPQNSVYERMDNILKDPDSEFGKLFVADIGWLGINDKNYADDVSYSAEMQYQMGKNAERIYYATGSEEVSVMGTLRGIRSQGAAGTDINKDVVNATKANGDPVTAGYQIQINPITKTQRNGEYLPSPVIRELVGRQLQGAKFKSQFGEGEITPTIDQLEFGDGVESTFGPNKGKLQWPVKYMGGQLIDALDQPVYWYWDTADVDIPTETPIEKTAAKVVNKAAKQKTPDYEMPVSP